MLCFIHVVFYSLCISCNYNDMYRALDVSCIFISLHILYFSSFRLASSKICHFLYSVFLVFFFLYFFCILCFPYFIYSEFLYFYIILIKKKFSFCVCVFFLSFCILNSSKGHFSQYSLITQPSFRASRAAQFS